MSAETAVKHTPLPWMQVAIHPHSILGKGQRGDQMFDITADAWFSKHHPGAAKALCEANAEFIVRIVNSHAALLEALEAAAAKLDKVASWLEKNAKANEIAAKSYTQFPSLADDAISTAKNYQATAKDIRKEEQSCRAAINLARAKGECP